jgi:hypothetical protein
MVQTIDENIVDIARPTSKLRLVLHGEWITLGGPETSHSASDYEPSFSQTQRDALRLS